MSLQTVCEPRTFRCSSWIYKRQRKQRLNHQHLLAHRKSSRIQKKSTAELFGMPKPLTVCITTNSGKFLKRWEYQTILPASWEICIQVKKQQRTSHETTDWFPNWENSMSRLYIVTCLFNLYAEYIMWNAWLDEEQVGIKILGELSITSDMQMTPLLQEKAKI